MQYRPVISLSRYIFYCFVVLFLTSKLVLAAGGCGSACLPLEALDVWGSQISDNSVRMSLSWQYAEFDNFREGGDDVTNPGGNSAVIQDVTLFLDYGLTKRFTVSFLLPFIKKEQHTNKFGERIAQGVGDVALFGRYELVAQKTPNIIPGQMISPMDRSSPRPSVAVGLGIKFPTGSIDEPGRDVANLPPPFQNGSGAFDLIPTLNYFQSFQSISLFGNAFVRIPLEKNKYGYEFGKEYEAHFGVEFPLRSWTNKVDLTLSLDYLHAEHDTDTQGIVPAKIRSGERVLNTGGTFVDITPGVTVRPTRQTAAQLRVFIPIHEDWNGDRSRNVGQVAPDWTTQLTFSYLFN